MDTDENQSFIEPNEAFYQPISRQRSKLRDEPSSQDTVPETQMEPHSKPSTDEENSDYFVPETQEDKQNTDYVDNESSVDAIPETQSPSAFPKM